LGLAQAAAGRVDIASRLLDRAAQIGGRGNEERLHELSAVVRAVTLCQAREQSRDEKEKAELTRRLVETSLPETAAILLIEVASTTEDQVDVRSFGGKDDLAKAPELDAEALGLYGIFAEVGATQMRIALTRRLTAGLGRPLPFKIHILRRLGEQGDYRLTTKQLEFAKDSAKAEANLSEDLRP
jgi:hypothetical protein